MPSHVSLPRQAMTFVTQRLLHCAAVHVCGPWPQACGPCVPNHPGKWHFCNLFGNHSGVCPQSTSRRVRHNAQRPQRYLRFALSSCQLWVRRRVASSHHATGLKIGAKLFALDVSIKLVTKSTFCLEFSSCFSPGWPRAGHIELVRLDCLVDAGANVKTQYQPTCSNTGCVSISKN